MCPIIIIPTAVTAPKPNTFSVDSTTATSITLRWSVSSDSPVDRYVVTSEESNSAASVTVTITDPSVTTYTLMGLESEATYSITVTASNAIGSTTSTPILVSTTEGMLYNIKCTALLTICSTVTSGSGGDNTAAVNAAIVLGTLLILSVTVIIIVTVTWLLKNHDTCKKYVLLYIFNGSANVLIHGSSMCCSISCISVYLNVYDYHYNHLPHSIPAGSTMDIPASTNAAYEFSSQLKEAIYK